MPPAAIMLTMPSYKTMPPVLVVGASLLLTREAEWRDMQGMQRRYEPRVPTCFHQLALVTTRSVHQCRSDIKQLLLLHPRQPLAIARNYTSTTHSYMHMQNTQPTFLPGPHTKAFGMVYKHINDKLDDHGTRRRSSPNVGIITVSDAILTEGDKSYGAARRTDQDTHANGYFTVRMEGTTDTRPRRITNIEGSTAI